MSLKHRVLATAPAIFLAVGCAQAKTGGGGDGGAGGDGGGGRPDASCVGNCDQDGDGVPDGADQCPDTSPGDPVNQVGCADSQLTPVREPTFPPYGLTFSPTGDIGRAGGLTWAYSGIQRGDLFHIYWIICDDPDNTCGLSLNGPIDAPAETWVYSATDSDLPSGKLVFTNTTQIMFADGTSSAASGRLTVTIVDESSAPVPFATVGTLGVTARVGGFGAEIPGTGFTVTALAEVRDPSSMVWTPYLDYFDGAPTADGSTVSVSFDGWFYDK